VYFNTDLSRKLSTILSSEFISEVQVRANTWDIPKRELPRQLRSMSLVDPEAPIHHFGSNGQRQVTVVQRRGGLPQALVTRDDSQWSWKSIDHLDKAVSELINEGSGNLRQSSTATGMNSMSYLPTSGTLYTLNDVYEQMVTLAGVDVSLLYTKST